MYSFTKKNKRKRTRIRNRRRSQSNRHGVKNGTYKTNKHKKRYIRGGVIYLDNHIRVDFDEIFKNTSIKRRVPADSSGKKIKSSSPVCLNFAKRP